MTNFCIFFFQLTLSSSSIAITSHLINFDQRFSTLLKTPVKIDYNKPPPAELKLDKSSKRKKRNQNWSEESPLHGMAILKLTCNGSNINLNQNEEFEVMF